MSTDNILILIYVVFSYWAINKVWYSRYTYITSSITDFVLKKVILGALVGWFLIPIAILMTIFGRKNR